MKAIAEPHHELGEDAAEAVRLVAGMLRRGESGEALRERRTVESWTANEAGLLSPATYEEAGTAVRVRRERESLLVARPGVGPAALREAVRDAARRAGGAPFFKAHRAAAPDARRHEGTARLLGEERHSALLAATLAAAVPDPRGLSISLSVSWITQVRAVISPKELLACGSSVRLEGVATVVRESGTRTLSFLSALPYEKALEKLGAALAEAARPVATVPPPDGEVDVVLSPSAAAVFWHEAVGHPLEADGGELVSVLARVPEAVVAPPGVDVIDDPGRRDLPGAYLVDDEGTPARRVPLIVDGCVRGLLTDRRSSGANANGHGRTPDYRRPVRARMSNLVVLAGRASMEDLLANLGTGLLVHEVSAGSADPESGRFVLLVERAQQVRRGKPGAFVAPFALAGEILGALSRLDPELGDLAEPAQGLAVCAKGGDPVPVGGSSPAILLRSLAARGRRASEDLFAATFDTLVSEERGPGHGAELYERWGTLLSLTEDDEGLHLAESSERGFALRLFRGGRASFAAAGEDGIGELAARARLLVPRARTRRGARAPAPVPGEASEDGPSSRPSPPDELEAREMLTSFRRTLAATGAGHVIAREITVSTGTRNERVATTGGRRARWAVSAATLLATVVGRTPKGRHSARVVATAARLSELPLARLARLAVDRVLLPITGLPAEPTRTDLLLDSHVAAHVIGRLAPLFFGDTHAGLLEARTRQGRDGFASSVVTLVDDGRAPLGPVQTPRDAEGTPVSRTVVVEKGRLAGRLLDVAEAGRTGHAPTGNAVRLTWSEPPQTGVTNFYVDPAAGVSPLDLLAGVTRGYYAAVLLERPDVDAAADRFRLVTAGYALEKGRATERVSEAVLTGRLSDLLRGITALGDDLKLVAGAGGAAGSPTLFIPRWKNS